MRGMATTAQTQRRRRRMPQMLGRMTQKICLKTKERALDARNGDDDVNTAEA